MLKRLRADARLFPTAGFFLKFQVNWLLNGRRFAVRRQLDSGVVVSLTSYPPRFPTLHLTLMSLLAQSYAPARIVLWIAHQDMDKLPASVTDLTRHGLEIKACDDLRSYKKLIPQLQSDPRSIIVTADDDVHYWRHWLQELVDAYEPERKEVIAHRVHRIRLGADGLPLPYNEWEHSIREYGADALHFPTGIGGVLYAPGVLDAQVLEQDEFMRLCPRGDDIWFWWMARRNGARFRRAPSVNRDSYFHCWDGSQACALWEDNLTGSYNDTQIAAMIGRYGFAEERKVA
ncbi:hypothetical protein [Herbaspirillum camelliae]|uniref:hypothetical protein n=1 Tax=Herbaspirillum camelliae TaxID=1892903 RepID=UPI000949EB25|nr:hypothetical protein [Herbaspirillum camelliae]